jgi:hypothetical protein
MGEGWIVVDLTHVVECVGVRLGGILHEVAWDCFEAVFGTGVTHDVFVEG